MRSSRRNCAEIGSRSITAGSRKPTSAVTGGIREGSRNRWSIARVRVHPGSTSSSQDACSSAATRLPSCIIPRTAARMAMTDGLPTTTTEPVLGSRTASDSSEASSSPKIPQSPDNSSERASTQRGMSGSRRARDWLDGTESNPECATGGPEERGRPSRGSGLLSCNSYPSSRCTFRSTGPRRTRTYTRTSDRRSSTRRRERFA